jgi:hypothetical protein
LILTLFIRASWLQRPSLQQTGPIATGGSGSLPQTPKGTRTAQVHISYLSKQLNFIISEQFLRDVFSNFGSVVEIALKKTCVDPVRILFCLFVCFLVVQSFL